MLDALQEISVQIAGLFVSVVLLNDLLLELVSLNKGIIELSVRVNELLPVDKHLEPFGHSLLGPVVLGKWTHDLRVVNEESRRVALNLEVLGNELVEQSGSGSWSRARDFELFTKFVQKQSWLFSLEILGHLFAQNLLELLDN